MKTLIAQISFGMVLLGCAQASAEHVVVSGSSGQSYVMELDTDLSFSEVVDQLLHEVAAVELQNQQEVIEGVSITRSNGIFMAKAVQKLPDPRDYYAPLTVAEKEDLTYILKTLANSSLIKIKSCEGDIKKAGDRIDNLHPFQFLAAIFMDEELKVYVRNIYGRSWVWKGFLNGVTTSLTRESSIDNVLTYTKDFANRVGVSYDKIYSLLKQSQWEKLVDVLIKDVPRGGDSGRYDM